MKLLLTFELLPFSVVFRYAAQLYLMDEFCPTSRGSNLTLMQY